MSLLTYYILCFLIVYNAYIVNATLTDGSVSARSPPQDMSKKILVVLTSVNTMGQTNKPTGWYLPELAHPYKVLHDAGFQFDAVSPKGGEAPVDPGSVEAFKDDAVCQWFQKDGKAQALIKSTKTPGQINPSDYAAVLYPGGHGPMFDLATDVQVAGITSQVFNNDGVVAAVCHGPAGLVPVKLANGDALVKGRKVTAFSNAEEDAMQLSSAMPFMLETRLQELGGQFSAADLWLEHVVVDGKLVTGQNPASSAGVAKAMVNLLA